jgi:hypothetical protein
VRCVDCGGSLFVGVLVRCVGNVGQNWWEMVKNCYVIGYLSFLSEVSVRLGTPLRMTWYSRGYFNIRIEIIDGSYRD